MPKRPTDGVALLVALIPYLVAEGSVSVEDAATHFDVPPERIRDAVERIFMSGVPDGMGDFDRFDLNFDALEEQGVVELSYLPAFDGSAVRLAPREAGAILAGLTLLAGVHGADEAKIQAIADKLRRAAIPAASTIAVDAAQRDDRARAVRDAIDHRVVLEIDYRKPGSSTERRLVAPARLELRDGEVYIAGHDLDRDAPRRFRLDRTESVRHSDLPFPEAVDADDGAGIDVDALLTVSASAPVAALLADYADGPSISDGDRETISIQAWNVDAVLRHVASLGGEAIVTAPASARSALRTMADQALMAYASEPHRNHPEHPGTVA